MNYIDVIDKSDPYEGEINKFLNKELDEYSDSEDSDDSDDFDGSNEESDDSNDEIQSGGKFRKNCQRRCRRSKKKRMCIRKCKRRTKKRGFKKRGNKKVNCIRKCRNTRKGRQRRLCISKCRKTLKKPERILDNSYGKNILNDPKMSDIFEINKKIVEEIINIFKINKDVNIDTFFKSNLQVFRDTNMLKGLFPLTLIFNQTKGLNNLCDSPSENIEGALDKLKMGHYLLLALLTETRFISAMERENRPALTKDNPDLSKIEELINHKSEADSVRLTGKMNLDDYLHILFNLKRGKYTDDSDYEKYKKIKESYEKNEVLRTIFGDDLGQTFKEDIFEIVNGEQIVKKNIWKKFCIPLDQRRIQVLIYDMINVLAYQQVMSKYKNKNEICEVWNQCFNNFKNDRIRSLNTFMKTFLMQAKENEHCIFLGQEVLPNYCKDLGDLKIIHDISWEEGKDMPKQVKKGEKSVIVIPDKGTAVADHDINNPTKGGESLNADITVATIDNILLISVHTPTDGKNTGDIITSINNYFEKSDYQHIIIGIDANTKKGNFIDESTSVLQNTLNKVDEAKLSLSYFSTLDIDKIENGMPDSPIPQGLTSGAIRTFLQSQYYKAMEKEESYVDFIMFKSKHSASNKLELIEGSAHKMISVLNTKLGSSGSLNNLLNDKNPSDHKPRSASFRLSGIKYHIISHNMAGPNGSFTEYASI